MGPRREVIPPEPAMRPIKIALAQIKCAPGDVEHNLAKHLEMLRRAEEAGASLVIFPELSLTGYILRDLAFELSDRCREALLKICEAAKDIHTVVGFVYEPRLGIYRNAAAVIGGGRILGIISKLHPPCYGLFEESRYFQHGDPRELRVFELGWLRFGVIICEDAWHPEPCELLARMGADLLIIIAASPLRGLYEGGPLIERVWEAVCITRAVENAAYVAFVNRVGDEDEECFWGGSMVVSPEGRVLAKAPSLEEHLLVVEVDPHVLRRARRFSSFREHRRDIHELLRWFP